MFNRTDPGLQAFYANLPANFNHDRATALLNACLLRTNGTVESGYIQINDMVDMIAATIMEKTNQINDVGQRETEAQYFITCGFIFDKLLAEHVAIKENTSKSECYILRR